MITWLPKVSVVIPAYNQALFLGEAIQSVINQTYQEVEVIVVNDASTDDTSRIVKSFSDPRVRLITHEENRGLPAARNTGMSASSGELLALLDADDIFHPEKLAFHVKFLAEHPETGVSYNNRFELNYSSKTIREIVRPPSSVTLIDLVQGFPFTPSDMVIRRDWANEVDLFDESYVYGGEDLDFQCRLALAGCQFARVDRALNYRRHHSGRRRKNLPGRLDDVERSLNSTFGDPRCPEEVLALGTKVIKTHLLVLVSLALTQEETNLGQQYTHEVVKIDPSILEGDPCELIRFLMMDCIADDNIDHDMLLNKIFHQLPKEFMRLKNQIYWAVGQGFIIKGIRAITWNRPIEGNNYFTRAIESRSEIDDFYLYGFVNQLLGFAIEYGDDATQGVIRDLTPYFEKIGNQGSIGWLRGNYLVSKAFRSYRDREFKSVPRDILIALKNQPKFVFNRGVVSIFFRSVAKTRI